MEQKTPIAEASTANVGMGSLAAPKVLLQLIPNPATEKVTLQITSPQNLPNTEIEVFNITGAKVHETTVDLQAGGNQISINLTGFEKGLYLVQVRNGETVLQTKLVKR